uniref:Uncharacterized protein n=1 Tax=Octopus bimaculoides TaxID=37653 RepID=A0A0L8HUP6_OCTBM
MRKQSLQMASVVYSNTLHLKLFTKTGTSHLKDKYFFPGTLLIILVQRSTLASKLSS